MKKVWFVTASILALGTALQGENGDPGGMIPANQIQVLNDITTNQSQNVSASGGASDSKANSNAIVNLSTTSISDNDMRTPPLTAFPPYLPYWTHGGWGTVKAYFPNGPSTNDAIYETTFDPESPEDMHELRSVLKNLPHEGLLEAAGGVLNSVAVVLFGAPDRYHHGRGLEIANSITRDRRPEGKPLLVFVDSSVDMNLLREEGYAYVGKVSIEGDVERNWDQAYKTAITEALLWDADILLISGGMKGVTVGSNVSLPSAAAGYSQMNYSLSLFGAKATGITEGKGKAVLSADAYRFSPGTLDRRRIPDSLYERIRARPRPVFQEMGSAATTPAPVSQETGGIPAAPHAIAPGVALAPAAPVPAPTPTVGEPVDQTAAAAGLPVADAPGTFAPAIRMAAQEKQPAPQMESDMVCVDHRLPPPARRTPQPPARASRTRSDTQISGIKVSRELLAMAGFQEAQEIEHLTLR